MKCHRCRGPMIYEQFLTEEGIFYAWRCITCGEVIDEVILKNRYAREEEGAA